MSIIRARRPDSNFYLLNKRTSEDTRLSWGARGLLVYLLGKPDHWKVSVAHLRKETAQSAKPTGRDGIYAMLEELIAAGYVQREQGRCEGGRLQEVDYLVSESPIGRSSPQVELLPESPLPAEPYPVEPYPANPTLVSTEVKQEQIEDRIEPKDLSLSDPVKEIFDHWRWAMKSPRSKMDDKRRAVIVKALKLYSVEDLKQAIDGCVISPFHMGANDRKEKYNGIDLILRDANKIEGFMGRAINPPAKPKQSGMTKDFSNSTYQGTPNDQFADVFQ